MDTPKRKSAINERIEDLVSASLAVEDALVGLFDHSDHTLQRRVVETYIRRLYQVRVHSSAPLLFKILFGLQLITENFDFILTRLLSSALCR